MNHNSILWSPPQFATFLQSRQTAFLYQKAAPTSPFQKDRCRKNGLTIFFSHRLFRFLQRVQDDSQHKFHKRTAFSQFIRLAKCLVVLFLSGPDQFPYWQPEKDFILFTQQQTMPEPAHSPVAIVDELKLIMENRALNQEMDFRITVPSNQILNLTWDKYVVGHLKWRYVFTHPCPPLLISRHLPRPQRRILCDHMRCRSAFGWLAYDSPKRPPSKSA